MMSRAPGRGKGRMTNRKGRKGDALMRKAKKPTYKGAEGDYDVGYGKPPVQSRFKRGQSGNPKGRPKGARNFSTDVKATLKAPVKVTRDGRPRKVSTQEAAL